MARLIRQAAVVPYRIRNARIEIALVTRSSGNGWIVPKGTVNAGEESRDAALREAEEEAGLVGVLARRPLGRYYYVNSSGPCHVDVYLMRVTEVREQWPEDRVRRRRWMRVTDAEAILREELRQFIRAVDEVLDLEL
jgi:8-oxo-dGTP pyrophosphatase MutT (NUDIX family)